MFYMTTRRNNTSHTVNVARSCDHCGRRDHKVVVRKTDGTFKGFCTPCFTGRGGTVATANGAVVVRDKR